MNLYVMINYSQRDIDLIVDGTAVKEISEMYRMDGERYEILPLCIPCPIEACNFCRYWKEDLEKAEARMSDEEKRRAWQSKIEHVENYCRSFTLETRMKNGEDRWEFTR